MGYSLRNVAILQFRQIKTGGEVFALARDEDGMDVARQRREKLLDANNCPVIEGVAFLRSIELQHRNASMAFGDERGWQVWGKALRRHSPAHSVSSQTIMSLWARLCNLSS